MRISNFSTFELLHCGGSSTFEKVEKLEYKDCFKNLWNLLQQKKKPTFVLWWTHSSPLQAHVWAIVSSDRLSHAREAVAVSGRRVSLATQGAIRLDFRAMRER